MAIKTSSNSDNKLFTEINITPLTDIFLVLLIIMMVVAPSFQSVDNNITVPEISSGLAVESQNATVAITKDGSFFVNSEKINDFDLPTVLVELAPTMQKKEVIVRADEKTKSTEIMKVMRAAQEAGYEKLTIAGEPLSKKEQRELDNTQNNEIPQE